MQQLNNLSDDANQFMGVSLPDGSLLQLTFIYRPTIQRWTLNILHPLLVINGFNLCLGPNVLRQWRNIIPFGLAVTSSTGNDPINPTDFLDGTVTVYILSAAEVQQAEMTLLAPVSLINP